MTRAQKKKLSLITPANIITIIVLTFCSIGGFIAVNSLNTMLYLWCVVFGLPAIICFFIDLITLNFHPVLEYTIVRFCLILFFILCVIVGPLEGI